MQRDRLPGRPGWRSSARISGATSSWAPATRLSPTARSAPSERSAVVVSAIDPMTMVDLARGEGGDPRSCLAGAREARPRHRGRRGEVDTRRPTRDQPARSRSHRVFEVSPDSAETGSWAAPQLLPKTARSRWHPQWVDRRPSSSGFANARSSSSQSAADKHHFARRMRRATHTGTMIHWASGARPIPRSRGIAGEYAHERATRVLNHSLAVV